MPKADLPILIEREKIQARITALGVEIAADYPDGPLYLIGVLNGSAVFLADLIRAIPRPVRYCFVGASSYGSGTESSGQVRLTKKLDVTIEGAGVLLVEDIVDTGLTLEFLRAEIGKHHPKSVRVIALLDKPERHQKPVRIDYTGFTVPNVFVVGYGLDYDEDFRDLPDVCILDG